MQQQQQRVLPIRMSHPQQLANSKHKVMLCNYFAKFGRCEKVSCERLQFCKAIKISKCRRRCHRLSVSIFNFCLRTRPTRWIDFMQWILVKHFMLFYIKYKLLVLKGRFSHLVINAILFCLFLTKLSMWANEIFGISDFVLKPNMFFQGEACRFAHGFNDLRRSSTYKTALCKQVSCRSGFIGPIYSR